MLLPKQDQWRMLALLKRSVARNATYGCFAAVLSSVAVLWGLTSSASPNVNAEGVGASVYFAPDRPEPPAPKVNLGQTSDSIEPNEPDLVTQLNNWTSTSSPTSSHFEPFQDPHGGDHPPHPAHPPHPPHPPHPHHPHHPPHPHSQHK